MDMSVIAGDTDHPYNLHLGQHLLAALTLEHLERTGLGDMRFGHRVVSVTQDAERVASRSS
jgi:4-nitrocatechol/4-nitrophenol 4-monooxygenase